MKVRNSSWLSSEVPLPVLFVGSACAVLQRLHGGEIFSSHEDGWTEEKAEKKPSEKILREACVREEDVASVYNTARVISSILNYLDEQAAKDSK